MILLLIFLLQTCEKEGAPKATNSTPVKEGHAAIERFNEAEHRKKREPNLGEINDLFLYASKNNIEEAKKFVETFDISYIDQCYKNGSDFIMPALIEAAINGNLEMVQLLVTNGADVNITRRNAPTPLSVAIAGNHTEVAKFLLQQEEINLDLKIDLPGHPNHNKTALELAEEYQYRCRKDKKEAYLEIIESIKNKQQQRKGSGLKS